MYFSLAILLMHSARFVILIKRLFSNLTKILDNFLFDYCSHFHNMKVSFHYNRKVFDKIMDLISDLIFKTNKIKYKLKYSFYLQNIIKMNVKLIIISIVILMGIVCII
jgi:hypothetical protein